jgi:hypothetical protein
MQLMNCSVVGVFISIWRPLHLWSERSSILMKIWALQFFASSVAKWKILEYERCLYKCDRALLCFVGSSCMKCGHPATCWATSNASTGGFSCTSLPLFGYTFPSFLLFLPVTMTTIEEALSMTKIMLTKLCNKLSSITSWWLDDLLHKVRDNKKNDR